MRFRTVVIAAVILALATSGGLAAYQISDQARAEAGQVMIDRTDELAVEPDIRQSLASDADHSPTAYDEDITVTYDGEEMTEGTDYEYFPESGEMEFLVDRSDPDEATIDYAYQIPENQVADDQLETLTEAYGDIMLVGVGLSIVVLLLFIGGFVARRMGVGSGPRVTGR